MPNSTQNRGMRVNINKTKVENVRSQCRRLQDVHVVLSFRTENV